MIKKYSSLYHRLMEKYDKEYQRNVGWNVNKNSDLAHSMSIEMSEFLSRNINLEDGFNVFEIGCAGGRNLKYLLDINPNISIHGNDLHRDASFENMYESVRNKINFYEIDTLSLMKDHKPDFHCDIIISRAHLMHIDPESVETIKECIVKDWKPEYVLISECPDKSGENTTRKYPRWYHELNFGPFYSLIGKQLSIMKGYDYKLWKKN